MSYLLPMSSSENYTICDDWISYEIPQETQK